ncbi:MAG: DUF1512 family protein [Candidatus Nanohalobium sp.]
MDSGNQIVQILQILSFLLFPILIVFGPRIMVWQADRKLRTVLSQIEDYHQTSVSLFTDKMDESGNFDKRLDSMKNFQFSAPTTLDPAGMVDRLENVLDASEDKFKRFIDNHAETEDEEELADLNMAFKGVMGTQQIYKVLRHYRELINETKNFQLVGLINMMLPIYEELAESQKGATRAFMDEAPIGDSIGPLVAAKLITDEPEEVADNIVHSEEEISGQTVHVIKSDGPGARLGKYGDAINQLAEENNLEAVVTVDAASKFEGEETGKVNEGVGVMMGGPGVEKSKIEEAATSNDLPLEGVVIKQSAPEASKAMKKDIYESWNEAVEKVKHVVEEHSGEVAVVGVGNTCGIPNTRQETSGVHNKLQKYWEEYEEQEEEDVSYMGLMSVMPGGNAEQLKKHAQRTLWKLPR